MLRQQTKWYHYGDIEQHHVNSKTRTTKTETIFSKHPGIFQQDCLDSVPVFKTKASVLATFLVEIFIGRRFVWQPVYQQTATVCPSAGWASFVFWHQGENWLSMECYCFDILEMSQNV